MANRADTLLNLRNQIITAARNYAGLTVNTDTTGKVASSDGSVNFGGTSENGTAEGNTVIVKNATIRGADTSGGSARLELGATLTPSENSPWSLNFDVTGYAGKKQGVKGGVSLTYMF